MPDIGSLIESAQARGLRLFLADGKVKVQAPENLDEDTRALIHELREHREDVRHTLAEDDPVLTVAEWFPHVRDFFNDVMKTDFDYGWLREHRPDLHGAIRGKGNEMNALGDVRLSEVMAIMRDWRELVLKAEFERRGATKK